MYGELLILVIRAGVVCNSRADTLNSKGFPQSAVSIQFSSVLACAGNGVKLAEYILLLNYAVVFKYIMAELKNPTFEHDDIIDDDAPRKETSFTDPLDTATATTSGHLLMTTTTLTIVLRGLGIATEDLSAH